MLEKCKDCCSRLFCMSVAELNGEDFETMANKKDCRKRVFTNADRIRAMTDEDLARKLVNTSYRYDWKQDEDYWYFPNGTTKTNYKPKAIEAWLEWLKHPAE